MKNIQSQLSLKNYKVELNLGWADAEREKKQTVYIDLVIKFQRLPQACRSDELEGAVCYDELTRKITEFCAGRAFRLIEYFARELYEFVYQQIAADDKLLLRINKPHPCSNLEASLFTIGDFTEYEL